MNEFEKGIYQQIVDEISKNISGLHNKNRIPLVVLERLKKEYITKEKDYQIAESVFSQFLSFTPLEI